ncbi:hypothetical protein BKA93DRAFT_315121 [Sparassis latifolia]
MPLDRYFLNSAWNVIDVGRMLEGDMTRLMANIDTGALAYAAAHAICTTSIPRLTFLDVGSYNRIFLLSFPNGEQVVARVPFPQNLIQDKISSEIATMTFARYYCNIPCPRVLGWSSTPSNPVGSPYILMDHAPGIPPFAKFYKETQDRRLKILDSLAKLHACFARPLPFSQFGSIYFALDVIARNRGDIDLSDPSMYRIGPYLRGPTSDMDIGGRLVYSAESSSNIVHFWKGCLSQERAAVLSRWGTDKNTMITPPDHPYPRLGSRTFTLGDFLEISSTLQTIISRITLPRDPALLAPCLVSTDYAFRNIFVDVNTLEVTSFLDWDDVSVMPFVLCTRFPEDISWSYGAPPSWAQTGRFDFVPNDDPPLPGEEYQGEIERQQQRAYYKDRLKEYDHRFTDKLWDMRKEPLKIQEVVTHGWVYWLARSRWISSHRSD